VFDAIRCVAADGIVCLTGVASAHKPVTLDPGAFNNELVLENNVVFGSVNANRLHYQQAADALARADHAWLDALITRRIPLANWAEAYRPAAGDVKTVLTFADAD
jgi:threonine dehydrogenase-like Zn-dependent dehydrogenase